MKTASPIRALVLLLMLAAAVYGGSVTHVATPVPSTVTNWNGSFVIPKFDPSMGTLTGIVITLTGDLEGSGTLINTATAQGGTAAGSVLLAATLTLTLPGADTLQNVVQTSYAYTLPPQSELIEFGFPSASNDATFEPGAANFGLYIGAGETLTLPVSAAGSWNLQNDGGAVTASASSKAGAGLTIRYDFWNENETPEPASFVLIGAPLLALGFFARKRLRR